MRAPVSTPATDVAYRSTRAARRSAPACDSRSEHAMDRFQQRVLFAVRRIPPGRVATYGDVAEAAGGPRAARAGGKIMKGCRGGGVSCPPVGAAGGRLGGCGGRAGPEG